MKGWESSKSVIYHFQFLSVIAPSSYGSKTMIGKHMWLSPEHTCHVTCKNARMILGVYQVKSLQES